MDQHEPQVQTNSNNSDSEISAARRILNGAGNFLNDNKDKAIKRGVALLAAGALTIGLAGCGANASAQGPEPTSSSSSEPTPDTSEAPSPQETETPTSSEFEIPAGLSAEEVGELIVGDRFTNWNNAGAEDSLLDRSIDENISWDDLLPIVADENKKLYADALYVDGWENDPNLVKSVDGARDANLSVLQWYTYTAWSSEEKPENKEGFKSWMEVIDVDEVTSDEDSRVINVVYIQKNNSDQNLGPEADPVETVYNISLQTIGDTEKISAISVNSK
jgi:hypothetical protein